MSKEEENRPSKKQREMLTYIQAFIKQNGYGPSYREVMNGLGYKAVSTVANHIDNLIVKGYLAKREYGARSLELVGKEDQDFSAPISATKSQEKWLVDIINSLFSKLEASATKSQSDIDKLYVLVGALQVLGLEDPARAAKARLLAILRAVSPTK
jgi:SOS-response transcriptional repressor LexA